MALRLPLSIQNLQEEYLWNYLKNNPREFNFLLRKRQKRMCGRGVMHNYINNLIAQNNITAETIKNEALFLQETLENLRINGTITNDAYLDAGSIEGGLSVIANMIELGIPSTEVQELLGQLLTRAGRIDEAHPSLGKAVAASRQ